MARDKRTFAGSTGIGARIAVLLALLTIKFHHPRSMNTSHSIQYRNSSLRVFNVIFGLLLAASATFTGRAQNALVVNEISLAPSGAISPGNGVVVVTWTGGTAPFQVQTCSSPGGAWQSVAGVTSAASQTNIPTGPAAFYRVVSVAGFSTRQRALLLLPFPPAWRPRRQAGTRSIFPGTPPRILGKFASGVKG